jgi:putative iron-dependent peroxidase
VTGVFELDDAKDTFRYRDGRDLTGYEDGTENPRDDAARAAALLATGQYLKGSSFVVVQRWTHDLDRFNAFPGERRDNIIGRYASDNEEIATAPPSAHVKRTAQESFEPAAFMVRRSMPWADAFDQGLEFVSFVHSLDLIERMFKRMIGLEDGIVDALFTFSRPVTGGYYWCPPISNGRLDVRALGI